MEIVITGTGRMRLVTEGGQLHADPDSYDWSGVTATMMLGGQSLDNPDLAQSWILPWALSRGYRCGGVGFVIDVEFDGTLHPWAGERIRP